MLVLHVEITLKPGEDERVLSTFKRSFEPAISAQKGFIAVNLMRAFEGDDYLLSLVFETENLRLEWVKSDLHQDVWPKMESHFSGYTIKKYLSVGD
ncbi:MAG: antibiotic biosynthesis monooxygenase [Chthonomonadales bacterium]